MVTIKRTSLMMFSCCVLFSYWLNAQINHTSALLSKNSNSSLRCWLIREATIIIGTTNGVETSFDNGATWRRSTGGLTGRNVRSLASVENILYAATDDGILKSENNAADWVAVCRMPYSQCTNKQWLSRGLKESSISSLAVTGSALFAGTANGVFTSKDNGAQWISVSAGLDDIAVYSLAAANGTIFAGTASGVFRSDNDGVSWTRTSEKGPDAYALAFYGNALCAGTFDQGYCVSQDNGKTWGELLFQTISDNVTVLSWAKSGDVLCIGTSSGLFLSQDNGATWTYHGIKMALGYGIPRGGVMSIVFKNKEIYVSLEYNQGIHCFNNGSFLGCSSGLPKDERSGKLFTCGGKIILSAASTRLYAYIDYEWKEVKMWPGIMSFKPNKIVAFGPLLVMGTSVDGVFVSEDGLSWKNASEGISRNGDGYVDCRKIFVRGDTVFIEDGHYRAMYCSQGQVSSWSRYSGEPLNYFTVDPVWQEIGPKFTVFNRNEDAQVLKTQALERCSAKRLKVTTDRKIAQEMQQQQAEYNRKREANKVVRCDYCGGTGKIHHYSKTYKRGDYIPENDRGNGVYLANIYQTREYDEVCPQCKGSGKGTKSK